MAEDELELHLPASNSWIHFWDHSYEPPHLVYVMLRMEPQALCSQTSTLQTLTLTPALAWLAYFALFPTGEAEEANGDFAPVEQAA